MKIFPSILQPDADSLFYQIENLKKKYNYFQIDIADGKLVDNKTLSINEIVEHLKSKPVTISSEFHLMVKDYEKALNELTTVSNYWIIRKVILHLKALPKNSTAYDIRNPLSETSLGIALNPDENIKKYYKTIKTFPYALIMSVIPGKQGNPFLPDTLKKVAQLRELGYTGQIGLDGGINDKTLPIIQKLNYLPDFIFPGSWTAVK